MPMIKFCAMTLDCFSWVAHIVSEQSIKISLNSCCREGLKKVSNQFVYLWNFVFFYAEIVWCLYLQGLSFAAPIPTQYRD